MTMTTIVLKPTPTRDARSSPVLLPQRCGGWCHLYKRPFSFIFTMQGFSAFAYHKSQRVVWALLPPSLGAQQDILNRNKTLTMTVPHPHPTTFVSRRKKKSDNKCELISSAASRVWIARVVETMLVFTLSSPGLDPSHQSEGEPVPEVQMGPPEKRDTPPAVPACTITTHWTSTGAHMHSRQALRHTVIADKHWGTHHYYSRHTHT